MNISRDLNAGLSNSSILVSKSDPPPGAPYGWPGCSYPLPLPRFGRYEIVTEWIWKTVTPSLILLGTVGNILTALVVFRNFRKLSSTAVYLLALAVTDTLFLYSEPLRRFILHIYEFDIQGISNIGCKMGVFLTYSSFHISAWILVAVTVERALSVIWPYKVKRRCTKRNAVIVTLFIVMAIFAVDSHVFYGYGNLPTEIYTGLDDCAPVDKEYFIFVKNQWFLIHFFAGFAIPFLLIAIGNTLVIRGLHKMRKRRRWMEEDVGNRYSSQSRHHGHHTRTLMIILILLNTIFFISQTPLAVYLVYRPYLVENLNEIACSDFSLYMKGAERLRFWEAITHNFGYLNASINFALYVVSGSRLRREIVSLFLCRHETSIRSVSSVSDECSRRNLQHLKNVSHIS